MVVDGGLQSDGRTNETVAGSLPDGPTCRYGPTETDRRTDDGRGREKRTEGNTDGQTHTE